jgi:hypothetical protein
MKKIKSTHFLKSLVVGLPSASSFSNKSKYQTDVEHSVLSFISSSRAYIESAYEEDLSKRRHIL